MRTIRSRMTPLRQRMLEDMQRSREAGFTTHLTKPVSIAALDKALAVLMPAKV